MNYLDLFHGIGGFALGAYWAGMKFEHHYCSDIEPWCQELYAKRFPDSVQLGDITKIDTSELPAGDWIITGGFPCQDISIAGKGAGIHGERSGLWFEYWRIINDLRPRFAIMENVGMLVHRGLREVLGSLAEIGYDAEWQDIRASDVGAPHRRERIWIVAYPEHDGRNKTEKNRKYCKDESKEQAGAQHVVNEFEGIDLLRGKGFTGKAEDVAHPSLQLSHGAGEARRRRGEFTDGGDVADAATTGLERQEPARGGPREPGLSAECGDEFPDAERNEDRGIFKPGFSPDVGSDCNRRRKTDWWTTEPAICGMVDGLPAELYGYEGRLAVKSYQRVNRLRGLGNAIVPQIAEILFRQIKQLLDTEERT